MHREPRRHAVAVCECVDHDVKLGGPDRPGKWALCYCGSVGFLKKPYYYYYY